MSDLENLNNSLKDYYTLNINYLKNQNTTYAQKYIYLNERIQNIVTVNGILFYLYYLALCFFFFFFVTKSAFPRYIKFITFIVFVWYPFYIHMLEFAIWTALKLLYSLVYGIPLD